MGEGRRKTKNESEFKNSSRDAEETVKTLPFTCPVCGKKTDRSVKELKKGAELICPFCNLKLILHGHMWEEVEKEMKRL